MCGNRLLYSLVACLTVAGTALAQFAEAPGSWPQWRGPNRDGIAPEKNLLKSWPEDGPPLLWKVEDIGTGYAPVCVAHGRIISVGYRDMDEVVFALDGNGKQLWATPFAPRRETIGMSFLSQRAPTVDEERVYAVSNMGELVCLDAATGKLLWRKNYRTDFKGSGSGWGYCDYPMVDGDKLIVCPGGKDAAFVALNRKTGEVIWKASAPDKPNTVDHSAVIVTEAGGVRQYVKMFRQGLVGVAAKDGKFLWRYEKVSSGTLNVPTPTARADWIHIAGGYGMGTALLRPTFKADQAAVEEVYLSKTPRLMTWDCGGIVVGERLHMTAGSVQLACVDLKTGKALFQSERNRGSQALVYADGHFYCRQQAGLVSLVEVVDQEYRIKGSFKIAPTKASYGWTMPTIAGGRLYLRDQGTLYCYNIRDPRQGRGPRTPFVPSPRDVVDKMLELADVKKDEVLVDLGCGDGRIVVAAAKKYGCKAIGYDLDPECLRRAQESVRDNQLFEKVRIVREDIFNVDLSQVDVVTLYLWPTVNAKLLPQLEKMKPGARIVAHAFGIEGVKPDKVIKVVSQDDGQERSLYRWTLPLRKETAR